MHVLENVHEPHVHVVSATSEPAWIESGNPCGHESTPVFHTHVLKPLTPVVHSLQSSAGGSQVCVVDFAALPFGLVSGGLHEPLAGAGDQVQASFPGTLAPGVGLLQWLCGVMGPHCWGPQVPPGYSVIVVVPPTQQS